MLQVAPSLSTTANGERVRAGTAAVAANFPVSGSRRSFFCRGLGRHSACFRFAAFQHATAYAAEGLHVSTFLLIETGDGAAGLQEMA